MAVMQNEDAFTFNPVGSHTELDISTVKTLTVPDQATKVMVQALDQNARYTLDGTDPTTSKGFQMLANNPAIIIPIGSGMTIKFLEEAATCDFQYQFGF